MGTFSLRVVMVMLQSVLYGCATSANIPITAPHVIIDKEGYPLTDRGERIEKDLEFREHVSTMIRDIGRCVDEMYANEKHSGNLLVYIHGGLNSTTEGLEYIQDIADGMRIRDSDQCAVFINWDADAMSALWDDLFEVRWGQRYWPVATITSPLALATRLINGFLTAPISFSFNANSAKYNTLFERPFYERSDSMGERALNTVESLVSLPFQLASLPVWTGLGGGIWEMLKRRIDRMFVVQRISSDERRKGAARNLLELLAKQIPKPGYWKTESGLEVPVEMTLVGHSMGAIVANRILREFPEIFFKRVIFLGAASSFEEFRASVIPYLARYKDSLFYNFSLAVKYENRERQWLAPHGSLLVWIDNIYEPGISPEKKRIGWWANLNPRSPAKREPREDLFVSDKDVCSRLVFIKFPGDETSTEPRRHGEFNDNGKLQAILNISMAANQHTLYNDKLCKDCLRLRLRCE